VQTGVRQQLSTLFAKNLLSSGKPREPEIKPVDIVALLDRNLEINARHAGSIETHIIVGRGTTFTVRLPAASGSSPVTSDNLKLET
jgi:signal transduction histidine kinase